MNERPGRVCNPVWRQRAAQAGEHGGRDVYFFKGAAAGTDGRPAGGAGVRPDAELGGEGP